VADNDDDRDDRDSDAPEEKKVPEKKSAKAAPKSKEPESDLDRVLAELRDIKALLHASQQGQAPHLWLLFPIAFAVLIQAIFMAMRI
jgi:hypothetical protein